MEYIQSIDPKRIAWCCAEYGITPDKLVSELDIADSSIKRVMTGQGGLTFKQLRKVANYLGRGALFFLETGPLDEAQVHTSQFRTLANQKPELSAKLKALIERVEKQRDVYLSLREDLGDADQLSFSPPHLPRNDPQESARLAREWLGLDETNDFDSYRAGVEMRGVLVFLSNGYAGKWQIAKKNPILGFTLYDQTCPVIVIKKQSAKSRQSFTLAHELGHMLLHRTSSIDDDRDFQSQSHKGMEREANAFAGHLLAPDALLATIQDTERPDDVSQYDAWLSEQRKACGASGEVILRRLLDTGRLSQSQYTAYRRWRDQPAVALKQEGNRKYRYREPKHIFGDRFVRTVLSALYARHITLARASSYLDSLKIKDLHRLERDYAHL